MLLVEFAALVLVTALLVVFSEDIAAAVKKAWGSPPFMNSCGYFLFSLFFMHYQLQIAKFFGYVLFHAGNIISWVESWLSFVPEKAYVASLLTLFVFSYIPLALANLFLFLYKRKKVNYPQTWVWFPWCALITLLILLDIQF